MIQASSISDYYYLCTNLCPRLSSPKTRGLRTPHSHVSCRGVRDLCVFIHQVTIRIMFDNKPTCIIPIIEDLRAVHVASDTPEVVMSLFSEIVMSQLLRVVVLYLEGRVVYRCGAITTCNQETMVINILLPKVDMEESCHVDTFIVGRVEDVGGDEIEYFRVPVIGRFPIAGCVSRMTELMDGRRAFLVPLEFTLDKLARQHHDYVLPHTFSVLVHCSIGQEGLIDRQRYRCPRQLLLFCVPDNLYRKPIRV